MNVGALLALVYFIFAVLGVFIFKDIKTGIIIDQYNNFFNFGSAFISLFRCSTGESWWYFMIDLSNISSDCIPDQTCGTLFAYFYFVVFIVSTTFVMI